MGRKYRDKAELVEQGLQLRGIHPGGAQRAQGFIEGAAPQGFAAPHLVAALLVLEGFFSDVSQIEIGAERPNDMIEHFRVECGDGTHQPLADFRHWFRVAAHLDKTLAQVFHSIQYITTFLIGQGVAQ